MNDEKHRSIKRSKKTAVSLSDIMAKEGAGLLIPGGSLAYGAIKTLVKHVRQWRTDKVEDRLFDFHEKMLRGLSDKQKEEFFNKEFSIEEYYALLNHVLQDEEDDKTDVYAIIFKALQFGLIPQKYRNHVVRCCRELKYGDFELMRFMYINDKYEYEGPGDRVQQIKLLTASNDPLKAYGIQTLYRLGCLSEIDKNKPLWPTELLKIIVELIYDEADLTEISKGKKAKTADTEILKVFFASKDISSEIFGTISHQLSTIHIRHVIVNPTKQSLSLLLAPIIAVCVGPNGSPLGKLKGLIDISKKTVVKILLPDAKEDDFKNNLADIFDFTKKDITEIKRFVEFCEKLD